MPAVRLVCCLLPPTKWRCGWGLPPPLPPPPASPVLALLVEGWSVASDEEEARGEREPIRFCTCGGCDDESEAAFFRLEDADVAAGDEPVDSRRVDPDLDMWWWW